VWRENNGSGSLRELLRPVNFVPEAKKVDELLAEMQGQRVHIAVVVDEYGGVAGLVTLEDIVEEIFGEIHDEYDQAEELPYQQIDEDEYLFHGRIDLDDLNEIMGSQLPTHEADTLGGLIYTRLGRVPRAGEQIEEDGLLFTIEQVSSRRIQKVRAQRVEGSPPEDGEEGENHAE
jgi:putative hemolysin